jgi:hypothetical protein
MTADVMKEYLNVIITSPDGERSWSRQGIAVPRVGDQITVRDEDGKAYIEGDVEIVHWGYSTNGAGAVVSVWLKEP